ncbi:hypothetical protein F3Y22_tig00111027pilonHSYRG00251 [Hibiscus syriacus]|uniref:Prolyl endopeptidase-like n=1 Tax=Hibiscus syriacus TaxID=106335 RepID=A0A6A2Z5V8_HIBSY|nr:hypothetical protein F3Y22_tig00111027pilonHSYRG00251 [Hibiscus syriacus]
MLLYGYGSYEISVDPYFNKARLSLLDRGFVFAIAHIRGGGEMGRQWWIAYGCRSHMRPDLWKAAVAGVPFVDVLTTMLDLLSSYNIRVGGEGSKLSSYSRYGRLTWLLLIFKHVAADPFERLRNCHDILSTESTKHDPHPRVGIKTDKADVSEM